MTVRRSRIVVFLLIFSLLFTSVVYACSGLSVVQTKLMSMSMDDGAVERGPCSKHRQDICKSVRERMLSIQPSSYKAIDVQQPLILLLPHNRVINIPKLIAFSSASVAWEIALHSVFKIPLSLSSSVLRI
jgi:uncharacterized membrane protein SpoIIM required for sporulation